jgi:hypothetical protein
METTQLHTSGKEAIRAEVAKQISNLGTNEYDIAVRDSLDSFDGNGVKLTRVIVANIQARRSRFSNGATYGTGDFWRKVEAESDASAKGELLAGSPQLAELNRLALEARSAQDKASAKERELNALWREFQSLPAKAEEIRFKLGNIHIEREKVADEQKLAEAFKTNYRSWLETQTPRSAADMQLAGRLLTERKLRLEVLDGMRAELDAEFQHLQKRNVEIARILAVKRLDLTK